MRSVAAFTHNRATPSTQYDCGTGGPARRAMTDLTHLQRLEAESIHIMREVVAECERPVMLYSIGKDSSVMLHLAMKAFYPAQAAVPAAARRHDVEVPGDDRVPRRTRARALGLRPARAHQPGGPRAGHQPVHARLRGAHRRDEDAGAASRRSTSTASTPPSAARAATRRSRAPRSASSRSAPRSIAGIRSTSARSCGSLYNARKHKGESLRVFPLSNWTELDIWQYIYLREHPDRAAVLLRSRGRWCERDGALIMVDDDRMPLSPGETPEMKQRALPHARLLSADRRDREPRPTRCRQSSRRCC